MHHVVGEGVRGDRAEIRAQGVHGCATEVEEHVQAQVRVPALTGPFEHGHCMREDSVLRGYSGIREREFCLVGLEQQLEDLEVSFLCCGYDCHESKVAMLQQVEGPKFLKEITEWCLKKQMR